MANSWLDYWNGEVSLYANARHKLLHDQLVARDIVAFIPSSAAIVLDHGAGDASAAADMAAACARLLLCDGAPAVRERLSATYARNPRIAVLSPHDVDALGDETLGMVVSNSMLQYLARTDTAGLLDIWHRILKPGGRLVIGDVISPDTGPVADAVSLLRFGASGGFFVPAFISLVRTALSDYRTIRSELGLTMYSEADMLALLETAGFQASRAARNIGHNQGRMTFVGVRN